MSTPEGLEKYQNIKIYSGRQLEPTNIEKPEVIGEVTLDEDEYAAIALQPKRSLSRKLDDQRLEVDIDLCFTKQRWESSNNESESKDEMNSTFTEKEKEDEEIWAAKSRQVYDPEDNEFDMRRRKVTDIKHNSRVILPKARPPKEEAMYEVRRSEWFKIFQNYKNEACGENGQLPSNLTPAQRRGMKKLKKRVDDGEIVVCQTDKSGKLAVMSMELYLQAGLVHTKKDKEVGLETVREVEKICNGHTAMWLKIWNAGADWKHQDRMRETRISHSLTVAALDLAYKDHKGWKPDDGGPPPSRPIAKANEGVNIHLSDLISEVLEPFKSAMQGALEVISTDDFLSKCDHYNTRVKTESTNSDNLPGNRAIQNLDSPVVIIGADAVNMYPSIQKMASGRAAKSAMMETTIKFEGVNYREAARYLAMELNETEIRLSRLRRILPRRRFKKGTKPTVKGPVASGPSVDDESQWVLPGI